MPHELCIEHGKAKLFYCGERPWHGLGQQLEGPATSREAITAAKLDWEVEKVPLHLHTGARSILVPDRFAVVRSDLLKGEEPLTPLGIVGRAYNPLQNRDAFGFFDGLVGGPEKAIYHTAGALGQGERVWLLAKLPGELTIGKEDLVGKYLLLSSSHDGQSSVQLKFTPIRVVCQNTLTMALNEGSALRVPHRRGIKEGLVWAAKQLGIIQTHFGVLHQNFQAMAEQKLEGPGFAAFLDSVIPVPPEPSRGNEEARERWAKRLGGILLQREAVRRLWDEGEGAAIMDVKHSLWTAYNAVTELVDHMSHQEFPSDEQRDNHLAASWFGDGASLKARAYREALAILKAA